MTAHAHTRTHHRGRRHGDGDCHGHDHAPHDHASHHHSEHAHNRHEPLRELGRKRLLTVLGMTAAFMVIEFAGGWLANSLALMADAGHMLSDVAALGLAAFALSFARRPATPAKTYGYLRIEILAALLNGATLIAVSAVIFWQAYTRLREPPQVEGALMLAVACAGLVVNLLAALLLHSSSGHNLNLRGAYLHVLGDLLGSIGAIAAALVILSTGWTPADPIISVFVALLILGGAWRLVRESLDVLLEAVPKHIDLAALHAAICEIPDIEEVHDLHVWTLTSGFLAMSGHAVIRDPARYKEVLNTVHQVMHDRFGISHVTMQVEHRTMYTLRRGAADGTGGNAPRDT